MSNDKYASVVTHCAGQQGSTSGIDNCP